jgi:hypothetical protein
MKAWTPEEDARLKRLYETEASAREIGIAMNRSKSSVKNRAHQLALKKPEGQTNKGRFAPGIVPWSKGKKGINVGGPTRFKPGHRGGIALDVYQPIGTERRVDGYLQRKVNDDMPLHKRWRAVHIIVWESANGPVPAGHAVAFKDGNKENIAIDNLECVSRREMMARNTVHNLPEDLRQVIRSKAVLIRKINDMTKGSQS